MTEIVFGAGAIARIVELADSNVFIVTDPGLVEAGHVARLESIFAARSIAFRRFDRVNDNPTESDVQACLLAFDTAFDGSSGASLVALGGGSSIDVAKGCATLSSRGGRMRDYVGRQHNLPPAPPVIAIPTTAGTGSEVQSFALITNDDTGQKMACGGSAPIAAILDPELTVTMSAFLAACTGLDTTAHAVETAVTRAATTESRVLSHEAFALVDQNLPRIFDEPDDLQARGAMLQASAKAGLAIELSMLGAAHSMANPLTNHFDIPHGQAVGVTLPHVVRFNAKDPAAAKAYADLARSAGLARAEDTDERAVASLVDRLDELVALSGVGGALAGVPVSAIDTLAAEAAEQWTAQFNPREVDAARFRELFRAAVQ